MVMGPMRYVLTNHHVFENARQIAMSPSESFKLIVRDQPDQP
jgi:hypothetical protein